MKGGRPSGNRSLTSTASLELTQAIGHPPELVAEPWVPFVSLETLAGFLAIPATSFLILRLARNSCAGATAAVSAAWKLLAHGGIPFAASREIPFRIR